MNSQGSGEGKDKTHQHTTAKYYPHDSHCRHGRDICLPARALIAMWISNYDVFIYKYFIVGQTVEIDPLGHVRVVEALQNSVQKCIPVILSEIHIHIAGVQVSLPSRHLLHKGFMSFPILCKCPYRSRCPVSSPTTMDSCCLLMLSNLVALLC